MALSLRVIPGYQFSENEKLTQTKLNQLGRPTIELEGTISAALIPPGSITSDKLSPGLISGLTRATPDGLDLMMFEDISSGGLRSATINEILALSTPHLDAISDVKFGDFAWIIQAAGPNKKATIENTLREGISGQTEITTAGGIDEGNDMLMLWDATALAGSNPNRKAKVGNVVASFTNILIAKSNPGTEIDINNDEVLVRDVSLTAPNQQVRLKVKDLVAQAGGMKAWANINGAETSTSVATNFWDADANVIGTALPLGLETGEFIWFVPTQAAAGVTAWTPYYVSMLGGSSTQFRLFKTKAAALTGDTAQLVDITSSTPGRAFFYWANNPIRGSSNISAIIRTRGTTSGDHGDFRIFFETPMLTENYAVQVTGSYYDDEADLQSQVCSINVGGADPDPPATLSPSPGSFDVCCRSLVGNNRNDPQYLMIAVFA